MLCVELAAHAKTAGPALFEQLLTLGQGFAASRGVVRFLEHPGFPVDIRHNAKIGREILAVWAQARVPAPLSVPVSAPQVSQ